MPKTVSHFLLSGNLEEKAELIQVLSWGGGVSNSHFFEKDGKTYLNTEGTLLTALAVEGSDNWYELFYNNEQKFGHIATTKFVKNRYEMTINSEQAFIMGRPKSLLSNQKMEIQSIEIQRGYSLDGSQMVSIIYKNADSIEYTVRPDDNWEVLIYRTYNRIKDEMTSYEQNFQSDVIPNQVGEAKLSQPISDTNNERNISKSSAHRLFAPSSSATSTVNKKEIPKAFICPISQEMMKNPVLFILDGYSYEKSNIENWLLVHRNSPKTSVEMKSNQNITDVLIPNLTFAAAIDGFRADNPELFETNQLNYNHAFG